MPLKVAFLSCSPQCPIGRFEIPGENHFLKEIQLQKVNFLIPVSETEAEVRVRCPCNGSFDPLTDPSSCSFLVRSDRRIPKAPCHSSPRNPKVLPTDSCESNDVEELFTNPNSEHQTSTKSEIMTVPFCFLEYCWFLKDCCAPLDFVPLHRPASPDGTASFFPHHNELRLQIWRASVLTRRHADSGECWVPQKRYRTAKKALFYLPLVTEESQQWANAVAVIENAVAEIDAQLQPQPTTRGSRGKLATKPPTEEKKSMKEKEDEANRRDLSAMCEFWKQRFNSPNIQFNEITISVEENRLMKKKAAARAATAA